jgi:MFS family permease
MLGRLANLYPALQNPHFRRMWLGMLPSTLAWQMNVVATGYAALTLSGSAVALGLVASSSGIPMLVLSPIGGVVADRFSRRSILMCTQGALGLVAAIQAALAMLGLLEVWHLVALGLVQGVAFSFNMPARQAYLGELLGPRLLRNAIGISNSGMNFNRIAGPSLAGILLAVPGIGVGGVFAIMTAMYAAAVSTVVGLPILSTGQRSNASPRAQLVEGLRYVTHSVPLRTLVLTAMGVLFFGMPTLQLMPLFSERVFEVGALGLGNMMAANGVGALVGSITAAGLSSARRQSAMQIGLGLAYGLCLAGFALSPSYPLALVLLGCVGAVSAAYTTINNTLVISNAEPAFHGRVMSIYLLTFAITPLSTLPMSWLSEIVGPRATVAGAGLLVAAVVAGTALAYPPYRRIG